MAFIPKDWRDASQDLTTPITAAALEDMESRLAAYAVLAGAPGRSIREGGASSAKTASQNFQIIQECIDEGVGTVLVPADLLGPYEVSGSLELHDCVSLVGEGVAASILSWPTSLGAGTWALTPDLGTGYAIFSTISGLSFHGPGAGAALVMGTPVSDMNGVKISTTQLVEHCRIVGFHRGLGVLQDHLEVTNCTIIANTYNLAFLAGGVGGGDHHYTSTNLADASIASVYVENGDPGIQSTLFSGVHMGGAPYGILSASGMSGTGFIQGTTFIASPIEAFGTAAIWGSNATDRIYESRFLLAGSGGWSHYAPHLPPATTYEFVVRSGTIEKCVFDAEIFGHTTAPGTAYVSGSGSGVSLEGLEFIHGGHQVLVDNDTRFLHRGAGGNPHFCSFSGPDSRRGTFAYASATVTQGQLLKGWGSNCSPYTDDTLADAPLGVALQNGAAGEIIAVQTEGYSALLVAGGTIAANRFLKPSATDGRVVQAGSWSDGPIVGVSMDNYTIGQNIAAHIRLGTWG